MVSTKCLGINPQAESESLLKQTNFPLRAAGQAQNFSEQLYSRREQTGLKEK
jgi:hypothetical protein